MTSISSGTSEGNHSFYRPPTGTPVGGKCVAHMSGFSLHNETYKTEVGLSSVENTVCAEQTLLSFSFLLFFLFMKPNAPTLG